MPNSGIKGIKGFAKVTIEDCYQYWLRCVKAQKEKKDATKRTLERGKNA